MKIIKKFSPNEKDLKESTVQTQLMKDFPPILKEKNPEVLNKLIAEFVKETGGVMVDDDTPDVSDEVPLQSKRKRTNIDAGSEATGAQTKKSKIDKSEAPKQVISSTSTKKRGKAESSSLVNQDKFAEAREERAKKMKAFKEKYEGPDFEMTPEKAKEAQEQAKRMIAARKKEKEAFQAARDAKLQSIGIDGSAEFYVEKLAEMTKIAESVEQLAVKEAEVMLEKIPEASESDASEAALESASKETQTSALPSPIPNPLSPSNDSDYDDIPIGQRMKKLQKPSSKPQQTTQQSTLQEAQTSAAAEGSEDPEEPKTSDLPTYDSPSNLYSLEKHLGGELQETPEKATKSVPEKTELVNQQQQQPKPIKQVTPEQTSTSTQTTQTQTTLSPQKAIPEPVLETVVPESVQVTESEPSVTITASEPIKAPTNNQTAINDQPSSSSTIQTNKPTNPHLLKSEFLEAEMMDMSAELQRLVQLRRSSTLIVDYQERWATLKDRASELLSIVSLKCIKIQEAANLHRINSVHLVEEDQAPLFLAYTPFFPKSDYMTREGRIVKLVKEKAKKDQEAAKAREDFLLQKQLELEAALKRQEALIAQLMNKQPNP